MFDKSSFEIIGRVGKIKGFNKVVRVSIASNASYKSNGEWVDPHELERSSYLRPRHPHLRREKRHCRRRGSR